jgi:hypothetical protein
MSAQPVDATFTPSSFGGGWIVPKNPQATRALVQYYGEEPSELMPLGGASGFIVEPPDVADVAGYMNRHNLVTEIR